jgi:hypothetical protein
MHRRLAANGLINEEGHQYLTAFQFNSRIPRRDGRDDRSNIPVDGASNHSGDDANTGCPNCCPR